MPSRETSPPLPDNTTQQTSSSQVGYQDCLACKLVGSATFIGLGSYSIYKGLKLNSTTVKNKPLNFRKVGLNVIGICEYVKR